MCESISSFITFEIARITHQPTNMSVPWVFIQGADKMTRESNIYAGFLRMLKKCFE